MHAGVRVRHVQYSVLLYEQKRATTTDRFIRHVTEYSSPRHLFMSREHAWPVWDHAMGWKPVQGIHVNDTLQPQPATAAVASMAYSTTRSHQEQASSVRAVCVLFAYTVLRIGQHQSHHHETRSALGAKCMCVLLCCP